MGLDIIAYKKLRRDDKASNLPINTKNVLWTEHRNYLYMGSNLAYIEKAFPNMAKPFSYNDDVYKYDECEMYAIGSYSTYGWFRRSLNDYMQTLTVEFPLSRVFKLLINYSDCEGIIGTYACKILFESFSVFRNGFDVWALSSMQPTDYQYAMETYNKFKDAFEFASDGGAVEFC